MCDQKGQKFNFIYNVGNSFWFRCKKCGFAFADRSRLVSKNYIDYYEGHEWPNSEERKFATVDRDRISAVKKTGCVKGNWFDIGFGEGFTLSMAAEMGYRIGGVEESLIAVNRMKKMYPDGCWLTIEEYIKQPLSHQYDVVSMYHVLEHIRDFKNALHIAAKLLKKCGLMVIEVPYLFCPQARLAPSKWIWMVEHHLNFFTVDNLMKMLRTSGIDFIKHEYRYTMCDGSTETLEKRTKLLIKRVLGKIGFGQALTVYGRKVD